MLILYSINLTLTNLHVLGPGKNFQFMQEKKYVFLVTLICVAEDVYPKPEIIISAQGYVNSMLIFNNVLHKTNSLFTNNSVSLIFKVQII